MRSRSYKEEHGVTPQSVKRAVQESLHLYSKQRESADKLNRSLVAEDEEVYDKVRVIAELEKEMRDAAAKLEFVRAAHLRDQIAQLKDGGAPKKTAKKRVKYR